jgi:hypothetical protein
VSLVCTMTVDDLLELANHVRSDVNYRSTIFTRKRNPLRLHHSASAVMRQRSVSATVPRRSVSSEQVMVCSRVRLLCLYSCLNIIIHTAQAPTANSRCRVRTVQLPAGTARRTQPSIGAPGTDASQAGGKRPFTHALIVADETRTGPVNVVAHTLTTNTHPVVCTISCLVIHFVSPLSLVFICSSHADHHLLVYSSPIC